MGPAAHRQQPTFLDLGQKNTNIKRLSNNIYSSSINVKKLQHRFRDIPHLKMWAAVGGNIEMLENMVVGCYLDQTHFTNSTIC